MTVQDILWINLQATRKVHHYNYARLEEATYYQYAYGDSKSLIPQAARFLPGFLKMHPFDAGNVATAFIACAAFLSLNGAALNVLPESAESWIHGIQSNRESALSEIGAHATVAEHVAHELKPSVQQHVRRIIAKYEAAIAGFVAEEDEARSA